MCFESWLVAVDNRASVESSRLVAGAAASLHLGEVEGKAVEVVPAEVLVHLDKVLDQMMMEEERGRQFLLLVHQVHLLSSLYLIKPHGSTSRSPYEKRTCDL